MSQEANPVGVRRIVAVEGGEAGEVAVDAVVRDGRDVATGVRAYHLWATGRGPVRHDVCDDGKALLSGSPPPPGGTRLGVLDIAPGAVAGALHRTDTVDYAICAFGEIELDLGSERRRLSAGDVVIQCGATHTWRNSGWGPARLVFVMIDAEPKRPGSIGRAETVARLSGD